MKNILKYMSLAFVGGIIFASCEKSRPVVYTGENFVAFEDTLLSIPESSAKEDANGETQAIPSIATIRINRGSGDISKDLVVSYSVKAKYVTTDTLGNEVILGDVPEGNFYLSSPGAVTIKAGEGFAFITVTVVDNDQTDGNKKLTFTIESTSDASFTIGYPGPDKKAKSMVLYIEDDDCPLDINDFVGTLKVEDVAIVSTPLEHSYLVTSTQVSPNSISILGLFDPVTRYPSPTPCPAPVVLVFNTATKDVIFSPTTQTAYYRSGGCPATTNPRVVYPDPAVPNKFNTCQKLFTLNYYVRNPSASGPFDFVYSTVSKP
ncbi:hypothetical protein [Raineya orbicola]|uniref:Calx-beta domain n=1 Tax=Raineya orbicola TaxID=2016530 RepID=A0A2N3IJU6_9BACT|nr:hypothetical protein [Raineya orbicola]PKQ70610.1 hypothetical protein Rain11_0340 [Raineya orbicola]